MAAHCLRSITAAAALAVLGTVPTAIGAQDAPRRVGGFEVAAFDSVSRIAHWLAEYDRVAWVTTDLMRAEYQRLSEEERQRLGPDWFCFERDSVWHAVYGRHDADSGRYDAVLHYSARPGARFARDTTAPDPVIMARLAAALSVTRRVADEMAASGVRFNPYVRPLADGHTEVWYVPAFQPNGLIVLGGELRYLLGPDNRVIDSTMVLDTLRGIRPDTTYTVHIDNQRNDVPTVGQTLFVLLYHPYFADIRIWNRRYQTWLLRHRNHPPAWVHAARPDGTGGGNR